LNFALDVVAEAPSAEAVGRHAAYAQQVRPARRSAPAVVLPAELSRDHVWAERLRNPVGEQPQVLGALAALSR
jgi:hypothetical protein